MMSHIRRYLLSGLLVWLPIWVTLLIVQFLVNLMDRTLHLLPRAYQPDHLIGFHIPGLGLIFTLLILFFTGMFVANFLGHKLVRLWDSLINRIPLVRVIYNSVKKALETVFSAKSKAFRKVLLVEYPRKGMWSIGFQTGEGCPEIKDHVGETMLTVFIPTTPNPTSGFLMVVPEKDAYVMNMTVDEGLKFIISLGMVSPGMVLDDEE